MAKLTLNEIQGGYLSSEKMNENFQAIEEAIENTVSRDGTVPNTMVSDFDMNNYRIINLLPATSNHEPITYGQAIATASGFVVQRQETVVVSGDLVTEITFPTLTYQPGANNIAVYVNGTRKFVPDFTETSTNTITFAAALATGDKVVGLTNNYVGTLDYTEPTSIAWSIVTGKPSFTTRWPTYAEVTDKPSTFTPAAHVHSTADITSGTGLADARRGVHVQAGTPTAGRTGELWLW